MLLQAEIAKLPREEKIKALTLLKERVRRQSMRSFHALFPDEDRAWDGPVTQVFRSGAGEAIYARAKYPQHMEFFGAGATYRERCFMAANRVGKTTAGGFEMTSHLTGLYRDWWPGRKFPRPISAWAAGKTNETTRDVIQRKLLGEVAWRGNAKTVTGTGLIPGDLIGDITWKQGVADLVDTVLIRHATEGWSRLGLKSYQQGRGSFEGTEQDVIWPDEEPPLDIYGEMLIRTATTNGIVFLTFTPLEGMSDVVMSFLPKDMQLAA